MGRPPSLLLSLLSSLSLSLSFPPSLFGHFLTCSNYIKLHVIKPKLLPVFISCPLPEPCQSAAVSTILVKQESSSLKSSSENSNLQLYIHTMPESHTQYSNLYTYTYNIHSQCRQLYSSSLPPLRLHIYTHTHTHTHTHQGTRR